MLRVTSRWKNQQWPPKSDTGKRTIKKGQAKFSQPLQFMVPEGRIELPRAQGPLDFESKKRYFEKPMISDTRLISLAFCLQFMLGNVRVFYKKIGASGHSLGTV